jgi:hypothetical protein
MVEIFFRAVDKAASEDSTPTHDVGDSLAV